MNERMLELARQVWPDPNISHANHMKFAELIVRESIVDFYRRYLDLSGGDDITEQVDRYVKDNFGVEE